MKAYKIVELDKDNIKTLFHGLNGSRTVPTNEWLEADVKIGRDGSGDKWYLTGWHTLSTLEEAELYLTRFKSRLDKLVILECDIKDTWSKEHSPSNVTLSRWIKFNKVM